MRLLVLCLVLSACTSFDSLDRGVCGNGLIEPGEDCDSSEPSCVRCAVTCTAATDCPTAAYACGADGLCHAPGGTLAAPASAGPFQVNDFRITDIGHDGAGDVVGLSRTSIVVKNGEPSGKLATGVSLVTPFQIGRPAFGDLDGDGSTDITLTTPDGLVSYTAPLGELTALPVQSSLGQGDANVELVGLYHFSNLGLGAVLSSSDILAIAVFDFASSANDSIIVPCGLQFKASALSADAIDTYRLSKDSDYTTEMLMAITGPTMGAGNPVKTCVIWMSKATGAAAVVTDITPAAARSGLVGHPVLADLDFDADKCPGLLSAPAAGGLLQFYKGSRSGSCTLAATAQALDTKATPGAKLVGKFPLTPPVGLTANDVLVESDGIYADTIIGFTRVYTSPRAIGHVEFGDVNGDGAIDAVVSSEGEDDIDILYRTVDPIGYQLVRLDTASRITSLTIADYDANGVDDIAYTELLDQYQRLEVAFCTADRPLEPVAVGAFPPNISMVQIQVPDNIDQHALAADLAVLTLETGARPPTVTVLHGSPQRTMLAYYDPTPDSTNQFDKRKPYQLRGAAVGRFAGGDALPDVATLGVPLPGHLQNQTNPAPPTGAWVMQGTTVGPDATPVDAKPVAGAVDCAQKQPAATDVCVDDALLFPWSAGDHDTVFAFDASNPPRASRADLASVNAQLVMTPLASITAGVPRDTVVRGTYAVDLDGDGVDELVATFAPKTTGKGAIVACTMAGTTPMQCDDLAPAIVAAVDGAEACIDAAPARVDYRDAFSAMDDGRALIALCTGGGSSMLERVARTADGVSVAELSRVPEALVALRVGDVTGDGIDDVAAIANDHGAETLEVFRQCSSRDAATCKGGGQ